MKSGRGVAGEDADLTPFGFAQGQDAPRPPRFLRREDRDIDLDLGTVGGVVHDTGTDFAGRRSEESRAGVKGEVTAQCFEVRPDDAAEEIGSLVSPYRLCQPRLQPEPFWSHDRFIEGNQRLGDHAFHTCIRMRADRWGEWALAPDRRGRGATHPGRLGSG